MTPGPSWAGLLTALLAGEALSAQDTAWAMGEIMSGDATPAQVAGFAVALRAKGESAAEVSGLAACMLERSVRLEISGPTLDTCGTGGDRSGTANISTLAAIVARGAGATVVKHGNRAASSRCGSADLLEALGVSINLPAAAVARCVATAGIGFCFAPVFHPAFAHTAAPRRELGIATAFNFLGPLTNPARPSAQAVGVSDARMAPVLAEVLAGRGVSALVFRGDDGLDELTTTTTSRVWLVGAGRVAVLSLDPQRLGIPRSVPGQLAGGDATVNREIALGVLGGTPGPVRDAVLLNAAAALVAVQGASVATLEEQLRDAFRRAGQAVDDGSATAALEAWITASQQTVAQ